MFIYTQQPLCSRVYFDSCIVFVRSFIFQQTKNKNSAKSAHLCSSSLLFASFIPSFIKSSFLHVIFHSAVDCYLFLTSSLHTHGAQLIIKWKMNMRLFVSPMCCELFSNIQRSQHETALSTAQHSQAHCDIHLILRFDLSR